MRPSVVCLSVACNVCIVAKRCVLPTNCLKKQIGNGLWGIDWSLDQCRVTVKDQTCDPNTLRVQDLEKSWRCYIATIANYQSLLWGSKISYPSDSLASCSLLRRSIDRRLDEQVGKVFVTDMRRRTNTVDRNHCAGLRNKQNSAGDVYY